MKRTRKPVNSSLSTCPLTIVKRTRRQQKILSKIEKDLKPFLKEFLSISPKINTEI